MSDSEEILREIRALGTNVTGVSAKMGGMEQSIQGVHARVGRVENSVDKLGTTTGDFSRDFTDRLARVEEGLKGVKTDATEAKQDAKKAGAKAGGFVGTGLTIISLALAKLAGLIPWGKG